MCQILMSTKSLKKSKVGRQKMISGQRKGSFENHTPRGDSPASISMGRPKTPIACQSPARKRECPSDSSNYLEGKMKAKTKVPISRLGPEKTVSKSWDKRHAQKNPAKLPCSRWAGSFLIRSKLKQNNNPP